MLLMEKTKLEKISFNGNSFNKSSEDDKDVIGIYLQETQWNSIMLDSLNLGNCNLTDDLFLPIVSVLKFVKNIDLDGNELTFKSLYAIFEVFFYFNFV